MIVDPRRNRDCRTRLGRVLVEMDMAIASS
jgi:hypothetical protein